MTFTAVTIRSKNDPQVIIEGLVNKFFTFFPSTTNVDAIYVGDQSISYNTKKGFPLHPLSNTIGLAYLEKIYVTHSDRWYMSGLKDDIMYVLIEDNPFSVQADLIIESQNVMIGLLRQLIGKK